MGPTQPTQRVISYILLDTATGRKSKEKTGAHLQVVITIGSVALCRCGHPQSLRVVVSNRSVLIASSCWNAVHSGMDLFRKEPQRI